ncbi:MAG: hypothetical protein KGJ77_12340 [Acidobacteriota bacterium]|nr:hypothetical protein [Acidobacteriota bacterium]
MPDDRTLVTELGTALGMLPYAGPGQALAARPTELALSPAAWDRLNQLHRSGRFGDEFRAAWDNGRAFLEAPDALRGRSPLLVEWTGGRRPPGDEVAPVDLRVDHVYLVSCKYLSRAIANASPGRLFEGLLATTGSWPVGDWYQEVAPDAYRRLYLACRKATGVEGLPDDPSALGSAERRAMRHALPGRSYPPAARDAYRELCLEVSARSAERWAARVTSLADQERLAWRLLRIGNASYFVLGADPGRPLRLRVASPWDWRQAYQLAGLSMAPAAAGQPQVDWAISYRRRADGGRGQVRGHVEIRWSHGRFAQPPEAKVYIDTPTDELPGYFPIGPPAAQPELWS